MNTTEQSMEETVVLSRKKESRKPDNKGFRVRIQISLVWFMIITILIIGAIIFIPIQIMFRENIFALVTTINEQVSRSVNGEISRIFDRAIITQHVIKESFEKKIVDINNKKEKELYYFSLLKSNSWFTWISLGYPDGRFFGVQREPDKDQINIINNTWDPVIKTGVRTKDIFVKKGNEYVFESTSTFPYKYYAPDRPWFEPALQEVTDIWTDVYPFDSTKKPGLNTAISLSLDGRTYAVISVAFELEDISLYLQDQTIGKTGSAFIINTKAELIASQKPEQLFAIQEKNEKGELTNLRLITIDNVDDNFLKIIKNAMNKNKIALNTIKAPLPLRFYDERDGRNYFITFMPAGRLDWVLATIIPDSDYLAEIDRNMLYLMGIVGALFIIVSFIIIRVARMIIVKPLLRITDQLVHVETFHLDKMVPVPSRIKEIDDLSASMNQMTQGLLSFQKYLPTELVQELFSAGIAAELGGEERELSIFFSDLVSFTKIFEKEGNRLIPQLAEYLGSMSDVILKTEGAIDKYIGDAVMAFWGAPRENPNHALSACTAAINYQKALGKLNARWETEGKPQFAARIGLNTGKVFVGNVGSEKRLNYTVLGDPVNLASRLESLNKVYRTSIMMGETTYREAAEHIIARKLDRVAVYGKSTPESIYELLAIRDDVAELDRFDWVKAYENGRVLYLERKWKEAIDAFTKVISMKRSEDYPSKIFIYFARKYMVNPPPKDWSGVTSMKTK
ncbi:MAG: adenylate/guanylate cyclase domain-containing protein [Spirochaetales bacterium]|nr:adenylate/guanylate cyclase domain-containing protein [Spirochaetales bacterium]